MLWAVWKFEISKLHMGPSVSSGAESQDRNLILGSKTKPCVCSVALLLVLLLEVGKRVKDSHNFLGSLYQYLSDDMTLSSTGFR